MLHDIGVVDHPEPFLKLVHQGMILGDDGEKMSKSRGNVINPDDVVKEHGADALRLYEMFMGPLEATKPWQTSQLLGVVRFRDRVYNLLNHGLVDIDPSPEITREMHKTIKKITEDIDRMSFNTAIASLMVYSNTLSSINGPIPRIAFENLIKLLSPIAPHVAEECWNLSGHKNTTITKEHWPIYQEEYCKETVIQIPIQVNGKLRATIEISKELTEEEILQYAFNQSNVIKFTKDMIIKKKIYIPGKIVNIVVVGKS